MLLPVAARRGLALNRLGWSGLAAIIAALGTPYVLMAASGLCFAPAADQGALNPAWFVALIATAFFGERLSAARKLGLGLILGGSVVLVHAAGWSAARSLGDALFLGASLLTAGFTVAMSLAKLDPLHAAALVSIGSLALYGPHNLAFCGARFARQAAEPPILRFTRSSRACS